MSAEGGWSGEDRDGRAQRWAEAEAEAEKEEEEEEGMLSKSDAAAVGLVALLAVEGRCGGRGAD